MGVGAVLWAAGVTAAAGGSVYLSPFGHDSGRCDGADKPCRTLAYTVKQAADGDTALVSPGNYSGVANFVDLTAPDVAKGLTVMAHGTSNNPRDYYFDALQGGYDEGRFMVVGNGNALVGLGFTGFTGGTNSGSVGQGAGQRDGPLVGIVQIDGSAEIRDCEFWNNVEAVTIYSGTDVRIVSTVLDMSPAMPADETAFGINVHPLEPPLGVDSRSPTPQGPFTSPTITVTNLTVSGSLGTAILLGFGTMNITAMTGTGTSTVFITGWTWTNGIFGTFGNSYLFVTGGVFSGNSGVVNAKLFDPLFKAHAEFDHCLFENNGGSGVNGAVMSAGPGTSVNVRSSIITHNHVTESKDGPPPDWGGGIGAAFYCGALATVGFKNTTFTFNSADDGSPGWCAPTCRLTATDVLLSNNTAGTDTGKCLLSQTLSRALKPLVL